MDRITKVVVLAFATVTLLLSKNGIVHDNPMNPGVCIRLHEFTFHVQWIRHNAQFIS
jgi:hypothetical protein